MLGEGGSGETWLCKDLKTGEERAVKFIQRPIPKVVLPMINHEVKVQIALQAHSARPPHPATQHNSA